MKGDSIARIDSLILDVAAEHGWGSPCDIVVLDDPDGALTRAALEVVAAHAEDAGDEAVSEAAEEPGNSNVDSTRLLIGARSYAQATMLAKLATDAGLRHYVSIAGIDGPLELEQFLAAEVSNGASFDFVLTRLPKALAELEYLANCVAANAETVMVDGTNSRHVTFIGGGNTKHMTRSQNDVLAKYFDDVQASRGQGKFRCLVAQGSRVPAATAESAQKRFSHLPSSYSAPIESTESGDIVGVGGVFGGASIDFGGKLLVEAALPRIRESGADDAQEQGASSMEKPFTVVDFGSGNGQVSLALLHGIPEIQVIATDVSSDAVVSTKRTLQDFIGEGRAQVHWDDGGSEIPASSVDAVLLNPPFHEGTRIDATIAHDLIDAAMRILAPGGTLYLVHNSHLRYRPELETRFKRVGQLARDDKFTVLIASGVR